MTPEPVGRVRGRLRDRVVQRAGARCEYCRCPQYIGTQGFSVEHITPRDAGGSSAGDNLALSCQGCNNHKYTRTSGRDPLTQSTVPLFHPRQDTWTTHFAWSDDYSQIIPLTPTGRATVDTLHLNRDEVVRFRKLLYLAGEHPPPGDASETPTE